MSSQTLEKFGNKVRVRVCGICFQGNGLLLINHKGLYGHDFWAPPGGGIDFGENAHNALKREFLEECGLEITIGSFLFATEFVKKPLHAVELFFEVFTMGTPTLGRDPELGQNQIINELRSWTFNDLNNLPEATKHGILLQISDFSDLLEWRGFYPIT